MEIGEGVLRFLGEGCCFFLELDMRTSKADGREPDMGAVRLGFEVVEKRLDFEEKEMMKGGRLVGFLREERMSDE